MDRIRFARCQAEIAVVGIASHQLLLDRQISQIPAIANAARGQDRTLMTTTEELPGHVVVRCLARACGKEYHAVARLDRVQCEMPGDLLSQIEAVALPEHKKSRRQGR